MSPLFRVDDFYIPLEKRAWQLTECMEKRRDSVGEVDLIECISHWSYDVMVSLCDSL